MNRCILDLRGLVLHSYHSDRNNLVESVQAEDGTEIPSATHAVTRFVEKYLEPILTEYSPIQIIAVGEGKGSNARRRQMFPGYKEKPEKDKVDESVSEQQNLALKGVERLLMHMGALIVSTPYCEADDTIAHLLESLEGNHRVYTVDNDLLAAAKPNIEFYLMDRSTGIPTLKEDYKGLTGQLITLYKSIVGDSSDKIKGVPGLGDTKFGTLFSDFDEDGMHQLCGIVATRDWDTLAAACKGSPESKELASLYTHREAWSLCWELAKLHPEWCESVWRNQQVCSPVWQKRVPRKEKIAEELNKWGLDDLLPDLGQYGVVRWLLDADRLAKTDKDEMSKMLRDSSIVAFDYESYDELEHPAYQEARKGYVDVLNQSPVGGSFCFGNNLQYSFYMPINHDGTSNAQKEDLVEVLQTLRGSHLVAHNVLFEAVVSAKYLDYRFPTENLPSDTAIMSSYVNENESSSLKSLSKRYLNYDQATYAQTLGEAKNMKALTGAETLEYAADDSIVTAHLFVLFKTILECEKTYTFYRENEPYFYEAHIDSFMKGVPIDWERLSQLQEDDKALAEDSEKKLRAILAERCSEVNEAGFRTLWAEVKEMTNAQYRAWCQARDQAPSPEALQKKLDEKKAQVREACRYQDYSAPPVAIDRPTLSAYAKSIGFPALRSFRKEWIIDWLDALRMQAEETGAHFTDAQARFAGALIQHLEDGNPGPLLEILTKFLGSDTAMWTGTELNIGSPTQMSYLLYGMLGLPIQIRNEAKEGSTRDDFNLEGSPATNDLAVQTWLVDLDKSDWRVEVLYLLKELRGARQRDSLYYKPYPLWCSPVDGNIHPQFRNCGTVTRRPTGSSPNLLQVSKSKDEGRMRSTILPLTEDEVIVSIDWSQQEVRIAAAVSGDENLLSCYVGDNRRDVHTFTSVGIMNVYNRREGNPLWDYEDYQRIRRDESDPNFGRANMVRNKQGKPTVFTILYGGTEAGLSRKLVVPLDLGKAFFTEFFKSYPGIERRQQEVIKFARKHGYSLTMFGNRKHVPEIISKDGRRASSAERQVVNMEMQGTAADICKMTCKEWVLRDVPGKTGATLYAFVYDEIVASVPKSNIKEYIDLMVDIMQITLPGTDIVLEAEASIGPSWGEQHELNDDHSQENIDRILKHETSR